jgi:hypothetical protein
MFFEIKTAVSMLRQRLKPIGRDASASLGGDAQAPALFLDLHEVARLDGCWVDHAVMLSVRTRVATARTGILSLQKRDRARLLFALGPHTMPQNFAVASPCSPWRFDRQSSTMGAGNPSYLKIRMDATAASICVTA